MKNIKILIINLLIFSVFASCKTDNSQEKSSEVAKEKEIIKKSTAPFAVMNANNEINFTAYKTTEKIGVGGMFKKIEVLSGGEGNSVKEAINNTAFSIPTSSLVTKDSSRDYKIKKFFFGIMDNTKLLSGKLMLVDEENGTAQITMNGETKEVPFTYTIQDKTFNMQTVIDINDWSAGKALASLHKVCEDLHRGADGVSKTWSEVALNISSTF